MHTSLVLPCYDHLARRIAHSSHQGRTGIRSLLESFIATGPDGEHIVLVFQAAQMSLRDMKVVFRKGGLDEDLVKGAIIELLKILDFLHADGEVVHTGITLQLFSPLIPPCVSSD